jgi:hypothetical protein
MLNALMSYAEVATILRLYHRSSTTNNGNLEG